MISSESPRNTHVRLAAWSLAALFGLAFLLCLVLQVAGPRMVHALVPDNIGALRGHSHAYVLPRPSGFPLLRTVGDTFEARYSRLVLTEDGRPLPFPHASSPAIEQAGQGRYVHLRDNELYFSTSDNSDPRRNGRVYAMSVPLTPMRGLTSTLVTLALVFAAAAAAGSARGPAPGARAPRLWPWLVAIAVFAAAWQWMILTEVPRIVQSGDGGVVAGIAAAGLHPERLAGDLVYGERANFAFYWTVTIPLTRAMSGLTADVGTAYALLMGPMLLAQMVGFLLLGRRLLGRNDLAAALAIMSVAPVYVIGGELWGSLAEPITRYAFNALFPYILLVALPPRRSWTPFAVMGLCGAGVYLHPVSAPSVAMALWFALALSREPGESWLRHALAMGLAGLLFVALAAPFAIDFVQSFPHDAADPASRMARELMTQLVGGQYHNLLVALDQFRHYAVKTQAGTLGWLWLAGLGALAALATLGRRLGASPGPELRFLGLAALGIFLASAGVTALDQLIAQARGSKPVQIDLIRNLRFLAPLALLIALTALARLSRQEKGPQGSFWRGGAWAFVALWLTGHQSLVLERAFDRLEARRSIAADDPQGREALRLMRTSQAQGSVLVLPATRPTEASELIALALRYGALRPSFYQGKDLNLLAYSGARAVGEWSERRRLVAALEEATTPEAFAAGLARLSGREPIAFVLIHTDSPAATLLAGNPLEDRLGNLPRVPLREAGPWALHRLSQDR